MLPPVICVIIFLACVGFALFLFESLVAIAAPYRSIIRALVGLVVFVLLMGWMFGGVAVPRIHLFR